MTSLTIPATSIEVLATSRAFPSSLLYKCKFFLQKTSYYENKIYPIPQSNNMSLDLSFRCLTIETEYPDPNNRRSAVGRLFVNEIRDQVTIDYEEYDVLYLTVRVVDNNTEIGQNYDECTYYIKSYFFNVLK